MMSEVETPRFKGFCKCLSVKKKCGFLQSCKRGIRFVVGDSFLLGSSLGSFTSSSPYVLPEQQEYKGFMTVTGDVLTCL